MKYFYLPIIIFLFVNQSLVAQNSALSWAKRTGNTANDVGNSVTKDASGNIYTTGFFQGSSISFSGFTTNVTSVGGTDIFISKQNSSGELLWVKTFGGTNFDEGTDVAVDASGNVYVTGLFYGTTDFNPATGTTNVFNLVSAGQSDVFVSKFDPNGNFIWARKFGSTTDDESTKILIDNAGNVITCGFYAISADFDPGTAVSTLTSVGLKDGFIQKMTSNGVFMWARSIGGTADEYLNAACIGNNNEIIFGGTFKNTIDFDPSTAVFNLSSAGLNDAFIANYNANGNFLWAKKYGSTGEDEVRALSFTNSQKIISTGTYKATVNFGGVPSNTLTALSGSQDIFVVQLDVLGNTQWAKNIGGTGFDLGIGITSDANSNIYACGAFQNVVDFDPGVGYSELTATGSSNAYILRLNPLGEFVWAKNLGKTSGCAVYGRDIEVDLLNNVYCIGSFYATGNFDPNIGILPLTSLGSADAFFHKMYQCDAMNPTTGECDKALNVNLYVSAYYNSSNPTASQMKPVLLNQSVNGATSSDCDLLTVELHNIAPPYALVATTQAKLNIYGQSKALVNSSLTGSYYIAVKHRNSIETWSALPVDFSSNEINYDFRTNANKAYGSNQIQIAGTNLFGLFSGDIDQDSEVSVSDYSLWEIDANSFGAGFLSTDIDGGGSVDVDDYSYWEANANNFISVVTP